MKAEYIPSRRLPEPAPAGASRPVALTIAGVDSGGGAGIAADLKVFALHGVYGCAAVTALTAQDTTGVAAIHGVPPRFVAAQLASVLGDLPVAAVKTGMLGNARVVGVIAEALAGRRWPLVVDPVLVAKGGEALLDRAGLRALVRRLLPLALLVTPNLPEAAAMLGRPVARRRDLAPAARALHALGGSAVLVKGGHLAGGEAVDVFFDGRDVVELVHPRRRTRHTHGTGCVLSAAIAARLAHGVDLGRAVASAVDEVAAILACARPLGRGHGPADPLLVTGRALFRQDKFRRPL